jgi:hypothetical protein
MVFERANDTKLGHHGGLLNIHGLLWGDRFALYSSREQRLDLCVEFIETIPTSDEETLLSKWTYPPVK